LPIDLGNDGHTPNGSHTNTGPNYWQYYPVVTSSSGNSIAGLTFPNYRVDIYRALGDPAAPFGGGMYLQNVNADANGQWSATLPAGLTSADVTLVATDPYGNSSEMSPRPVLLLPLIRR